MITILCVEDEVYLLEEIAAELSENGYNVLQAHDGLEALQMIIEHQPDLIVCDITMPRMNGHELVKKLRDEHPEFANIPLLFLSALADRNDILEGMNLGADDYLTKPVDIDILLGKIKSRLRQVDRMQADREQQLLNLLHHDALTGLPNRALIGESIEQALNMTKRGQNFAMLCLDLDGFKNINDMRGHAIGDKLLIAVATRLQSCVREIDTVARMGGDEFAIVQALSDQPQDATALAQRIIDALKKPFDLDQQEVVIGVSIGIALAPDDGTDQVQLLKNADLALYRAKEDGRGRYCFYEPQMNVLMQARRQMELDLRQALQLGQFELYYQPLVNLESGDISGFEALIRWHHPERGMIAPNDFIPLTEETGLIIPLGEWIIRTACAQAALWPAPIKIAVNLSPAQFLSDNLVNTVFSALANSAIAAGRLELEITETVMLQNSEATMKTLHRLKDMGVAIAMDDFGTGYSSLSYLRQFPFDKIKLDRSFVNDLSEHSGDSAIVKAVANMSRELGIKTTAEGVETEEQKLMVKSAGYTEMQGYLFSRARTATEISQMYFGSKDEEKISA